MEAQQEKKRVSVHTLGCKLNYAETSSISRQFIERGFELTASASEANVFILNTCSVTENAEKECRQVIRRVLRKNPNAFVAVTGCYAQLRPEEIASIEGVDVVLGSKEKFGLFDLLPDFKKNGPRIFAADIDAAQDFHFASSASDDHRTRAFLKVQDGCDYSCAFCTIPMARGTSRSADVESVLQQARKLSADGYREIIFSGVNVGDFGRKSGSSFLELAKALEQDDRVTARLRVSSIEPNLLSPELIELIAASQKLCSHFHIPLQSGSNKILRSMQRRYTRELYRERIETIKTLMPEAGIGADVIVGFPGETEEDFIDTYEFIASLDVSYLHVFTYSERPETKALELGERVEVNVRKERNRRLRILSEKKLRAFNESQLGRNVNVIFEIADKTAIANQTREGYSENYVRVEIHGSEVQDISQARVRLLSVTGNVARGEVVEVLQSREQVLLPIL